MIHKKIMIVCGKPRQADLKILHESIGNDATGLTFWANSEVKSSFERFENLNVIFKSSNLLKYDQRHNKFSVEFETIFEEFCRSKYFCDALFISDRAYPLNLSFNNAFSYLYEVFEDVVATMKVENPERVVFDNVPHDLYSICIFAYCKIMEIDCSYYRHGQHIDDFLVFEFKDIGLKKYQNAFHFGCRETIAPKLSQNYSVRLKSHTPEYMYENGTYKKNQNKLMKSLLIFQRVFKLKVMEILFRRKWIGICSTNKELDRVLKNNDPAQLFYLPLHFQPEATTQPLAGNYACQYLAFKRALALLKEDQILIVKEHPAMTVRSYRNFFRYRTALFERYHGHPQVIFAPFFYPNFKIMKNCKNIVSIAGTTFIEASSGEFVIHNLVPNRFDHHPTCINLNDTISAEMSTEPVSKELFIESLVPSGDVLTELSVVSDRNMDNKERIWRVITHEITKLKEPRS